ncbi:proteasome endopeptidase complex, archaeal, alpha subunit [archaeon CG_4_10_14_0_2_um_filter_Archaea_38_6]|nr:MAG: proteasome endopeptidase complex, archaeal, alpha subunit [archaeon CG07_land_8_20_14_0_80_38_8]PIU88891.1 MAG: proteasome endopeptidase complex, archaeal, alpha subunit [archaeon CG06_land_8_20_14_3_00_37_11]PJA21999.1 MAG: proteasome endopeptidase complex, archaeal, alpha subunit [archaeon CG_4_10_14_0_2_um_filter_Archaea_38_6]
MPQSPGNNMGYDRAITVFSPDGRLLQVEYAKETVNQGTPAIGVTYKDGVLLLVDKRILEKLVIPESVEKIIQVDEHIGAAISGLPSDGRVLVDRAQQVAQNHKTIYDEPIDTKSLVKDICDQKQAFTQYGGMRPYGVSLLVAGVDDKPHLYMTEVSGIFFELKAGSIGENSREITNFLDKNYKEGMTFEEALKLAKKALMKGLDGKFDEARVEGAFVDMKSKKFTQIEKKMLKN